MIHLSKINGKALVVNCDLIELIEGGPDTIVTLTTGSKIVVQNPPAEIIEKVIAYRRSVNDHGVSVHVHTAEQAEIQAVGDDAKPDV